MPAGWRLVRQGRGLGLHGGAIYDAGGDTAILTLPNPGAVGSLGGTKVLVIDTTPPAAAITGMTSQIPGFLITGSAPQVWPSPGRIR
jgi:hypothetical protein